MHRQQNTTCLVLLHDHVSNLLPLQSQSTSISSIVVIMMVLVAGQWYATYSIPAHHPSVYLRGKGILNHYSRLGHSRNNREFITLGDKERDHKLTFRILQFSGSVIDMWMHSKPASFSSSSFESNVYKV